MLNISKKFMNVQDGFFLNNVEFSNKYFNQFRSYRFSN